MPVAKPTSVSPSPDTAGPYHFSRPDINEAREAIHRLYGSSSEVWTTLLSRAGLSGHETDDASYDRLITTMLAADPVISLCARSLQIRMTTYKALSDVHTLISGAE